MNAERMLGPPRGVREYKAKRIIDASLPAAQRHGRGEHHRVKRVAALAMTDESFYKDLIRVPI
jgi:hypothetical protein